MNWFSTLGELAKTSRVVWLDIKLLIKDWARKVKIENDTRDLNNHLDGMFNRKPPADRDESRPE